MTQDELLAHAARLNLPADALKVYLDAGQGILAEGVARRMYAMVKTVGSACNLDCTYCYYLSKEQLLHQKSRRMADDVLARYIENYIASQDGDEVVFSWHGGEPTLLGVAYFERVVELQRQFARPGLRIENDLQTNGTLLDDAWCAFFKRNNFEIGLSIDGPRDVHEAFRPDKQGASTFDAVVAGARLLKQHGVPFNTLTVINRQNARRPIDVYRFLRDELGSTRMQFIPCVQPRDFKDTATGRWSQSTLPLAGSPRARPDHPMSVVTEWSVDPEDWGYFLSRVFDEWSSRDQQRVQVNLFQTAIAQTLGQPSMLCTSSPVCGKNVAVEHDGTVYACDHYVYPEHELGNIRDKSMAEMVFSLQQLEFGLDKKNSLPSECKSCRHLNLCWGECPRTRLLRTREGEGNLSYLCAGWKRFYDHATPTIRQIAKQHLARRAQPVHFAPLAARTTQHA
ncbi:anaerobic sulfatase maturase [Uliginosibacterium sp. sgz301328]|uniref:anaerobic sulfatase maturase n=1 Tax=Uliginosibacterium sp. sgz301328 TaxID=3243764 RepID=UPI00359D2152